MPPPRPALPKKAKPGLDPAKVAERGRGALLGLAVGDALGATCEMRRLGAPDFPTLADGPHTEMLGGGPFNVKPGQVTDDTQMATCLAWSLREVSHFDQEDVARRYVEWLGVAFDVGEQTRAVLTSIKGGVQPALASRDHWEHAAKRPAGNGSLMRCAPIGVFLAKDRQARIAASLADSAITHYDPRCQLACVALNAAIAQALASPGEPLPDQMVSAALADLAVAAALLGKQAPEDIREIREANESLRGDLEAAKAPDPMLYGPELHLHTTAGFVRVAFRYAFWVLFHAPSFDAGLLDVVNRGGDADTNGAIAGALLGARFGEGAIRPEWADAVLDALPGVGPLSTTYHPRELLPLVD